MTRLKSIVFINQDSGYLMIDIINAYVTLGYSCVLVTGRLVVRNIKLHSSVRVEKIIKYNRTTTFRRLFTWIWGFLQIWIKVIFKFRNDLLFIVSNPPIATLLPLLVKNPYQLFILDIYPDALSELGYVSEKSFIIKWWAKSNKKVFKKALTIFTLSNGMQQVLQKYADDREVKVVSLWTDNSFFKPINPIENPFVKKHHLSEKFTVMYSGNFGLSGNVEVLLKVATELNRDDIVFLIIGAGAKKEMLKEESKKLGLSNVNFLPWQPATELPQIFSAANIAVITLGVKTSRLAVPSKLYNFLSVGAPLLCLVSPGSEVENLVTKYDCGKCFEPTDIKGIVDFIIEMKEKKEIYQLLKTNSLKASEDFISSNVNLFTNETGNVWGNN